jgi:hypothetical protein
MHISGGEPISPNLEAWDVSYQEAGAEKGRHNFLCL